MSLSGFGFYTTASAPNPRATLKDLLKWSGATGIHVASRSRGEERGWEEFQNYPGSATVLADAGGSKILLLDNEDEDWEGLDTSVPLDDVPSFYTDGRCLMLNLANPTKGVDLWKAVVEGIPESIRGDCCPGDTWISIGSHDIFDRLQDDGKYIARAFVSVRFYGHSTPLDAPKMEDMLFALPKTVQLRREMQTITGALHPFVEW